MRKTCVLSGLTALCVLVCGAFPAHGQLAAPAPPEGAAAYEAPARPTDGANMVLTVKKLHDGFDPPRPLVIWAIGSSFTNGLGNGDRLKSLIAERFPNAPEILYRKQAGCSTSYHFCRGWAQHLVISDQPDVVLLYNFGRPDELEKLIVELRRHTTADILVGTLHWCQPHKQQWPDPDLTCSHQDISAMRAMCQKYGVELVENRRELTEYMLRNELTPDDMLADSVHETRFAADCTVQNIARHCHVPDKGGYETDSRERRVEIGSDAVKLQGDWTSAAEGAARTTRAGTLELDFTGNRVELIGHTVFQGGTAKVFIDGKPADQLPVFYLTYVQPGKENALQPPMPPRDRAPHRVDLGPDRQIVPQKWTITITSDKGDYQLVGSATGPDGQGNAFEPFTSNSRQISIDPAMWRAAKTNRTGDTFTFEVYRPTSGQVGFVIPEGQEPGRFRVPLAENLDNGPHRLKMVATGDGPVVIEAFEVFEPPLK